MLEVKDLVKSLKGRKVLDGISFTANVGERLAILGGEDVTRSSLIRSICKLTSWDSGQICLQGKSLLKQVNCGDEIGIILEGDGNLNHRMSVVENALYLGVLRGMSRQDCSKELEKLLHRFGLEESRDEEIGTLSLRYRQRAAIICAIIHNPRLIIIDTPEESLSTLSLPYLQEILDQSIDDESQCLLIATDDAGYLKGLCDRVLLIEEGCVSYDGNVEGFDGLIQ